MTSSASTFVKTLVFLDLEATGLPTFQDPKTVRCTEISLIAVNRMDFDETDFNFRVLNKLSLCINPGNGVSLEASLLSGLDNFNLESQRPFSSSTGKIVSQFLEMFEQPVCLLAHNGDKFDFPLLKAELVKVKATLPLGLLSADTYKAALALVPPPETDLSLTMAPVYSTPPYTPQKYPTYSPTKATSTENSVLVIDLTISPDKNGIPDQVAEVECLAPQICRTQQLTPKSKRALYYSSIYDTSPDRAVTIECPNNAQNCRTQLTPERKKAPYYSPVYAASTTSVSLPRSGKGMKRLLFPANEPKTIPGIPPIAKEDLENPLPLSESPKKAKMATSHPKGYRLKDLYERLLKETFTVAHQAEADTVGLMRVCHQVKTFSQWLDKQASLFADVNAMW